MSPTTVRRGQLLLAKLGSRSKKNAAIASLIDASELPGTGWVQRSQNAWRTGTLGKSGPAGKRAHDEGLFTAVRSFEQTTTGSWLVDQVTKFVSPEDALLAVREFSVSTMWANPRFTGAHLDEQETPGFEVSGADSVRAFEWRTEGPDGIAFMRLICSAVGPAWILVNSYRTDRFWNWDELARILAQHSSKHHD